MNGNTRRETMRRLASAANRAHCRGDTVLRQVYSTNWRELATAAEAQRAAKYLTWVGR